MKRIATICARSGSKRLKDKNIREVGGRHLIGHSIVHARASGLFDLVVFSSDSEIYREIARHYEPDYTFDRGEALSHDSVPKIFAIRDAVLRAEELVGAKFDTITEIGATTPLREPEDIVGAVALLESRQVTNVITGSIAHRRPDMNQVMVTSDLLARLPLGRSESARAFFDMNGSIYVWSRDRFIESPGIFYPDTLLYEMPRSRSVDIDEDLDLLLAEALFARKRETIA